MANVFLDRDDDTTLRVNHLVAKKSAQLQVEQAAEVAEVIGATSVQKRLLYIRDCFNKPSGHPPWSPGAASVGQARTVALTSVMVVAHMMLRNLKKECVANGIRHVVLKCIGWAEIAMKEAVVCCIVGQFCFPDEAMFIHVLDTAYALDTCRECDLRSQLIKAYHVVFGGLIKAFKSKASRDTDRRGRVRPRRDPKPGVQLLELVEINGLLAETMSHTTIPPQMTTTIMGEPRSIDLEQINKMMVKEVESLQRHCFDFDMRSFIKAQDPEATAPYNAGEMLKTFALHKDLLSLQRERICGVISVIAEGEFQKLEVTVDGPYNPGLQQRTLLATVPQLRDQYSAGLQQSLEEDITMNGGSLPFKQDDPEEDIKMNNGSLPYKQDDPSASSSSSHALVPALALEAPRRVKKQVRFNV